ncbi:pentapeptide repeat-containing protein [Spirulina subsalsa]|uniref:pentapeptide repeat-containing protein n=1 Tax=Spirulina subsalsa TaxID=54311 RepID=UPI0002EEE296|nr:pentapeptide repeat-containing protein [Spirulina subsalsa]
MLDHALSLPSGQQGHFITTEPLESRGEAGEKLVWDLIQTAFQHRPCLAYWRYPIFSGQENYRQEPDILIVDLELGLIVIEVKSINIQQIVNISGHQWHYQNFYTNFGNPYQQAESHVFALLNYCDREPQLKHQLTARALLALPYITQGEWEQRGFANLPSSPPILFKNDLVNDLVEPASLLPKIQAVLPLTQNKKLTYPNWKLLLSIIAGTPLYCKPIYPNKNPQINRGKIIKTLRQQIHELDLEQERIAKQIPPGCQRIRGIAGSGKTAILCQKAAHFHLKYPQWRIAFVFFSRSLYQPILKQIDQWLRYFSQNQVSYDSQNPNLQVLHGWGAKNQPGFYRLLCQAVGIQPLTVNQTQSLNPNEALAEACLKLLQQAAIPALFDAILIDEGQDLVVDAPKFEEKQPFYWLAYQALRPVDPTQPEQRRLIWGYDETQSLESLSFPSASEVLGERLGHLVTGEYEGGIKKSEILRKSYRTPHLIITTAQALAMGFRRSQGLLTGSRHPEEWQALGYTIEAYHPPYLTLHRPPSHSPNPLPRLWPDSYLNFNTYPTRQEELSRLAQHILHNLRYEGLRPSPDILVIVLGSFFEARQLEKQVAQFLLNQGIDIYLPSTSDCNQIEVNRATYQPNKFWCDGAVTVSRIHRAKGHEAEMVYVVGLDQVAKRESEIKLRNQLLVAFTRSRSWLNISGIGAYPLYRELREILEQKDRFTLDIQHPPQREIHITDVGEILQRYAKGGRNFRNANLPGAELAGLCLKNANFIGANLRYANLQGANLEGVKFMAADLTGANFQGANLRKAKLMGALIDGVNFKGADLSLTQ